MDPMVRSRAGREPGASLRADGPVAGAPSHKRAGEGRRRLHEAALELFAEHGVSGTSLQMIADALGVTKAALYWHHRSKHDLVLGVITPYLEEVARLVEAASTAPNHRARVQATVTGLVDIVVAARQTYIVMAGDPAVQEVLSGHETLRRVGPRVVALLSGPEPDDATRVAVASFTSQMLGPLGDPACSSISDEDLRGYLVADALRLLLPERTAASGH